MPNKVRGFTLIEVLVGITVISIIVASLYSAFFLSHRAVTEADGGLLKLQESRALLDMLKKEVEASVWSPDKAYTAFKVTDRDFYGKDASGLSFTGFSPLMPGLLAVSYAVEESGGRRMLKKRASSAYDNTGGALFAEMMEDVESFTVEALYGGRWLRTWDSSEVKALPDEVRITVAVLRKGGASITLTEVARPRFGRSM